MVLCNGLMSRCDSFPYKPPATTQRQAERRPYARQRRARCTSNAQRDPEAERRPPQRGRIHAKSPADCGFSGPVSYESWKETEKISRLRLSDGEGLVMCKE